MQFQISFALGRTNQLFMTNQTNQQKLSSSTIIPLVMGWPNHDVVAIEDETHEKDQKWLGARGNMSRNTSLTRLTMMRTRMLGVPGCKKSMKNSEACIGLELYFFCDSFHQFLS